MVSVPRPSFVSYLRHRIGTATHRRNKAIPNPRNRLDIARRIRQIAQRVAKFLHRFIQAMIEINEHILRPQPLAKLLARNYFSRALQQHRQQLNRLLRQPDSCPALAKLTRSHIEFKKTEAEDVFSREHSHLAPRLERQHECSTAPEAINSRVAANLCLVPKGTNPAIQFFLMRVIRGQTIRFAGIAQITTIHRHSPPSREQAREPPRALRAPTLVPMPEEIRKGAQP